MTDAETITRLQQQIETQAATFTRQSLQISRLRRRIENMQRILDAKPAPLSKFDRAELALQREIAAAAEEWENE